MTSEDSAGQDGKRWVGAGVAALMATPLAIIGLMAIAERHYESASRIGRGVTVYDGPPAVAAGMVYVAIATMLLSVAAAQWPHLRRAGVVAVVVSVVAGVVAACLSMML